VRWWLIAIGLGPEQDARIEANADFPAGLTMVQQGAVDVFQARAHGTGRPRLYRMTVGLLGGCRRW
jgi:hypothetical protein